MNCLLLKVVDSLDIARIYIYKHKLFSIYRLLKIRSYAVCIDIVELIFFILFYFVFSNVCLI